MARLVAVPGRVRHPAERPAIGHPHRHRLARLRQARGVERRPCEYGAKRGEQRLLARPIEIARHNSQTGRRRRGGHLATRRWRFVRSKWACAAPRRSRGPRFRKRMSCGANGPPYMSQDAAGGGVDVHSGGRRRGPQVSRNLPRRVPQGPGRPAERERKYHGQGDRHRSRHH